MVPILYLAIGAASIVQYAGWNERSHYAQVRALDAGTARIDRYASDTGDLGYYKGHYYSDKAPGLALFTVPFYALTRGLHISSGSEPNEIHILALFGSLVPAAILLLLIASFVERQEPGLGLPVAMLFGFGTLLLPFSTMLFSHILSACLGFGAYYLLWLERNAGWRLSTIGFAGALAGFGVATEYPQVLAVAILAGYLVGTGFSMRRLAWFAGGVLIGVAPLLIYNWWAFGSPTHVSYANVAANHVGVFGLVPFSLHAALDLLFGARGLFTLTPVLAAAVGGIFLLYRRGRRADAWVAGAAVLAYVLYNASYWLPFGGWSPGPRFLIPAIPFLALPLATALRRVGPLTLGLGAISVSTMIAATLTVPELPSNLSTSVWWDRLGHGTFVGLDGTGQVLWFALLAALAVGMTVALAPRPRVQWDQLLIAALGIAGWLLVDRSGGTLIRNHNLGGELALIAIVAAASVVTWQSAARIRWHGRRQPSPG